MRFLLAIIFLITVSLHAQEKFRNIESTIGQEENVIHLELTGKQYKKLPNELRKFKRLKVLSVKRAGLTTLPSWLSELPIERLILTKNNFDSIPKVVYRMRGLKHLDLGHNNISFIATEIENLQQLKHLNLWANPIYNFPIEMAELTSLQKFNLRSIDLNRHEQAKLNQMLPNVEILMSPPCNCN